MTSGNHLSDLQTWVSTLCIVLSIGVGATTSILPATESQVSEFLAEHCIYCHGAETQEAGLDLTSLTSPSKATDFDQWVKILDKVNDQQMPPDSEGPLDATARNAFLESLSQRLHGLDSTRQAASGRVVVRRLNRFEYANTMHDLLGISTPLQEMLPEDGTHDGFDNVGQALNLSVAHLERYLQAADMALREATVSSRTPISQEIRTDYEETWHDYNHGFQNSQWVNAPDGRLAIVSSGGSIAHGTLRAWSPPVPDARYRFRIRARAMMQRNGADGEKILTHDRHIIARVGIASQFKDGLALDQTFFELSPNEYREFVYEARIPAGHSVSIAPHRVIPQDADERGMQNGMCVVVDWVEIEGPLHEGDWPPRGHQLLYGDLPLASTNSDDPQNNLRVTSGQPEADAERLLRNVLPLIFRRPISEDELAPFTELFCEQLSKGRPFDDALRAAYKMAFTSPQFLFLQEQPGTLDDYSIAARLSYGLWGTLPDSELMALAANGELRQPDRLREQVERLLTSPKAHRFTKQFLRSWLDLREIDFTQPDLKLYPEFDSYLQDSMVAESELFFEELLAKNLSVRNLLDSEFVMLNARLAEHYDLQAAFQQAVAAIPCLPGRAAGEEFPPEKRRLIRVALPDDARRGGVITQGAVLKVSANGTTTSPIVRGAYFLERILGRPPDPPPSNVPAVEPDIRGATTIRQQLDKHRSQAACAGCHAKLDPPGFALENYDVTGKWREFYRIIPESAADEVVKNAGSDIRFYEYGPRVEAQYTLADGRSFADIDEFKELMLEDSRQVARCMIEKLTTHLTGAPKQFADRVEIERILDCTENSDFGLRDLLHEVIQSQMFQIK